MKNKTLIILLIFLLHLAAGSSSYAAEAKITLHVGDFAITTTKDFIFTDVTWEGTEITSECIETPTLTIINKGHIQGWHILMECGDFKASALLTDSPDAEESFEGTNMKYTKSGSVIPQGILPHDDNGGIISPNSIGTQPLGPGNAVKILSAAEKRGLGIYQYTPPPSLFNLTIPPTTLPGEYTATVTITLNEGP